MFGSNYIVRVIQVFFSLLILSMSMFAEANPKAAFTAWYGDLDGDGYNDVYIRDRFIMFVGSNINTPIPLYKYQSYLYKGNALGNFVWDDIGAVPSSGYEVWPSDVNVNALQKLPMVYGDFDGDGSGEHFLMACSQLSSARQFFALETSGDSVINVSEQCLSGVDSYEVSDFNRDGVDDIGHYIGGDLHAVSYGSSGSSGINGFVAGLSAPALNNPAEFGQKSFTAYAFGQLSGKFSVNAGAASYQIPLTLPNGPGGVVPQVGLSYSSGAGNGALGVGWSLSAGGVIARCAANYLNDGVIDPVDFDDLDRFCMNGQRLVVVSGSYGDVGAEYRLEREAFARIQSVGGVVGRPVSFTVTHKSGDVFTYGGSVDSRWMSQHSDFKGSDYILSWSVSSQEDASGNKINYKYGDNATRLDEVVWGINKVSFSYGKLIRSDISHSNLLGTTRVADRLLESINVTVNSQTFRDYHLAYDLNTESSRYRLNTVHECGADSSCLKPVEFEYGDGKKGWGAQVATSVSPLWTDGIVPIVMSLKGDGSQQLFFSSKHNSNNTYLEHSALSLNDPGVVQAVSIPNSYVALLGTAKVARLNNDNFDDLVGLTTNTSGSWQLVSAIRTLGGSSAFVKTSQSIGYHPGMIDILVSDVNGDGYSDVILKRDAYVFEVMLNNKNNGFVSARNMQIGVSEASDGGLIVRQPKNVRVVDLNQDGLDDLVWTDSGKWWVTFSLAGDTPWSDLDSNSYFSAGSPFSIPVDTGIPVSSYGAQYDKFIDINGDGFVDSLSPSSGVWLYRLNNGGVYTKLNPPASSSVYEMTRQARTTVHADIYSSAMTLASFESTNEYKESVVYDYDEDGMMDLLVKRGDPNWYVIRYNGFDFSEPELTSTLFYSSEIYPLDLNGDGFIDLVQKDGNNYYTSLHAGEVPSGMTGVTAGANALSDYLVKVTSGNGGNSNVNSGYRVETFIDYDQLRSSNIYDYTEAAPSNSELMVNIAPIHVVSAVRASNGKINLLPNTYAPDYSWTEYFYKDLISHRRHGDLGFREIYTINVLSGQVSHSVYSHDYSNYGVGLLLENTVYSDGDGTSCSFRTSGATCLSPGFLGTPVSYTKNTWYTSVYGTNWPTFFLSCGAEVKLASTGVAPCDSPVENWYGFSNKRYFQYLKKTEQRTHYMPQDFAGGASNLLGTEKRLEVSEYSYDTYGNLLTSDTTVTGINPLTSASEDFITSSVNVYAVDDPANWYLGKLTQSTVTKSGTGLTPETRASAWTYYPHNDPYAPGAIKTETVAFGDALLEKATTYTYNTFGARVSTSIAAANVPVRTSSVEYDVTGSHVVKRTDMLGNFETAAYHSVFGLPVSTTNANGLQTTWLLDAYGRTKQETKADGTFSTTTYGICNGSNCPAYSVDPSGAHGSFAITFMTKAASDGSYVTAYYDLIGREIMSETKQFNGAKVYSAVVYDAFGRKTHTSHPFSNPISIKFTELSDFDYLGRPLKATDSDGSTQIYKYYGAFLSKATVNILDPINGNRIVEKFKYSNAVGQIIRAVDAPNTSRESLVNYVYDAYGKLIQTTDSGNNVITMEYDDLGNKIKMNDPDLGEWEYLYDGYSQLVLQEDAKNNKSCQVYDLAGRLIARYDSYQPGVSFSAAKTDALNGCNNPGAGVLVSAQWAYDVGWKGALNSVTGTGGYSKVFTYDALGRATNVAETIDGTTYHTSTEYVASGPSTGKVRSITYPTISNVTADRLKVHNVYGTYGHLVQLNDASGDAANDTYYWKLNAVDERGKATAQTLSNGAMVQNFGYNADTGVVETITAARYGSQQNTILNNTFQWDSMANLIKRQENITEETIGYSSPYITQRDLTETFFYDELNRLKNVAFTNNSTGSSSASTTLNMTYDALGNIRYKSDVGNYLYGSACGAAGPHMVCQAGVTGAKRSYIYDANGNTIISDGRSIDYTSFNKPSYIASADVSNTINITYGAERSRIKRVDTQVVNSVSSVTTTIYSGGGAYERITRPTKTEEKYYVGGFLVVTMENQDYTTPVENYLFKDHLGSVIAVADALGAVVNRMSFDPWGRRRDEVHWASMSDADISVFKPLDWNKNSSSYVATGIANRLLGVTTRGFTGHEMLDSVGFIHMNGRVYDPVLGRFLSADPFIQSPTDTQSLNRYTYVKNNPLSMTDPSGFFWNKIKKLFKAIVRIIFAPFEAMIRLHKPVWREFKRAVKKNPWLGTLLSFACGPANFACAALINATTNYALTGSLKSAFKAGVLAYAQAKVSQGIGDAFEAGKIAKVEMSIGRASFYHGVAGGAFSVARGGKFGAGFAAGSFTSFAHKSGISSSGGDVSQAVKSVVIGGTASVLGGGKFANGAQTAAFVLIFNDWGHMKKKASGIVSSLWRKSTAWHFEGRDVLNGNLPTYEQAISQGSKWTLLSPEQSIFHDDGRGKLELKFIHPDGREAVFNGDSLSLVIDPRYVGTYNYVNPAPTPDKWYDVGGWSTYAGKGFGHLVLDVVPYGMGGNVRGEH